MASDAEKKLSELFAASQKSNSKEAKKEREARERLERMKNENAMEVARLQEAGASERQIRELESKHKLQEQQLSSEWERLQSELANRLELQERESAAAAERQAKELASRLEISNLEQAGAMARLEAELGVRREDIANNLLMSRERIGFDREKMTAEIGLERDKLALAREEMLKIGIPAMEADKWYKEAQVALAQESQKIDREKIGVERGRLGFDVFSKAVEMASSPASKYQFGDFASGLAQNPQAMDWLAAMAGETARSGFGPAADAGVQPITPEQALQQFYGMFGATVPAQVPHDQAGAVIPPPPVIQQQQMGIDMEMPGGMVSPTKGQPGAAPGAVREGPVPGAAPGQQMGIALHSRDGGVPGAVREGPMPAGGQPAVVAEGERRSVGRVGSGYVPGTTGQIGDYGFNDERSYYQAMRLDQQQRMERGGAASPNETFAAAVAAQAQPAAVQPAAQQTPPITPGMQAFLDQQNAELKQIEQVADRGAGALMPGTFEGMGDDGVAAFVSGLKKLRRDPNAFMADYGKTRVHSQAGAEVY